jgi:hypothetical protein
MSSPYPLPLSAAFGSRSLRTCPPSPGAHAGAVPVSRNAPEPVRAAPVSPPARPSPGVQMIRRG